MKFKKELITMRNFFGGFAFVFLTSLICRGDKTMDSIYSYKVKTNTGTMQSMEDYKGKTLLIVNVASKCGFTPQYEGLEKLHQKYKDKGLVILGFPCNQFGAQEPGSDEEIKTFCKLNYGVTFPIMSKIDVNGDKADPLYKFLKSKASGIMGTEAIKWNFTKFLVSSDGSKIERFAPQKEPKDLEKDIEKLLNIR